MIRNRDILNSLPLLASVLGDQYGVEVRIGGNRARTNGRIIFLPSLPLDCDANLLGLARGYIDHEAAHIRHTDFKAIKAAKMDAVTFNLFNAIEDWRVENRLAAIFPGCRQNLSWLIRHIFMEEDREKNENPTAKPKGIAALNYVLLTVRGWDVPELAEQIQATRQILDTNFSGFAASLDMILDKVRKNCPDSQSAIGYARELAQCIRDWQSREQPEDQPQQEEPADAETSGVQAESDNVPVNSDREMEDETDTVEQSEAESASPDRSAEMDGQKNNVEGNDKSCPTAENFDAVQPEPDTAFPEESGSEQEFDDLFKLGPEELPASLGEITSRILGDNACDEPDKQIVMAVKGRLPVKQLSEADRREAMQASLALRIRLASLLQTRTQKQCWPARIGRLNPSVLHRLSTGNPRVFLQKSEQPGLNTAVHILVDASGSMRGNPIRLASLACYAVAKALEHARGISLGVTAFPAWPMTSPAVCPLVEHGQKITAKFMLTADCDTPLAEALWWVAHVLCQRKERRKIILIISDGSPNAIAPAKCALKQIAAIGMEPYGIGIADSSIANLLPETSQVIQSLDQLAPAMFRILEQTIVR